MPSLAGHELPSERDARIKAEKEAKRKAAVAALKESKEQEAARIKAERAAYIHPLAPKPGGRPAMVKATPEVLAKACASVRKGLGLESALILAGISWSGMDKWRKANPAVEQALKLAERQWEEEIVGNLYTKAKDDAKVSQWLLERRMGGNGWAPMTKTELTGKDGGAIQNITVHKQLFASIASGGQDAEVKRAKADPIPVHPAA